MTPAEPFQIMTPSPDPPHTPMIITGLAVDYLPAVRELMTLGAP